MSHVALAAVALLIGLAAVGATAAGRTIAKRRLETMSAARHPRGPDGVIIGAGPIAHRGSATNAVLLVHGFGDTPQTLAYLAADLHARGWTVRVPLLPGHGRTLPMFARSRARDWIATVRQELASLHQEFPTVALVGLSMGGALATIAAADTRDLITLVLIAPYLGMPAWMRLGAHLRWVIGAVVSYVQGGDPRSIQDPAERDLSLAYDATTPRLVAELLRVVREATAALPRVTVPTLLVQSRGDNRVSSAIAEQAFARLGAQEKRLVWTTRGGHIITVDYGRDEVSRIVAEWLDAHRPRADTLATAMLRPA